MSYISMIAEAKACQDEEQEVMPIGLGAYSYFLNKRDVTMRRAEASAAQKTRLALKIPYHEWAQALAMNQGIYVGAHVAKLLEAYCAQWDSHGRRFVEGPRIAPLAPRRARCAGGREPIRDVMRHLAYFHTMRFLVREQGRCTSWHIVNLLKWKGLRRSHDWVLGQLDEMAARGLVRIEASAGRADFVQVEAIDQTERSKAARREAATSRRA